MDWRGGLWWRRSASCAVDFTLELWGGLLGSYFGAMVAALVTTMRATAPEQVEQSVRSGFGLGFAFWALSISIVNRVLIQGVSRSSIGKKLFKLELISSGQPLSWSTMMTRWVVSVGSMAVGGAGYFYAFFNPERRTLHDLIAGTDVVPTFQSTSLEVEYVEETFTLSEVREILVSRTEPALAEVIPFPTPAPTVEEAPTGSDGVSSLADVISIEAADPEKKKKAA